MSDTATPAFSTGSLFRRISVVVWLPVVAAALLIGFSVFHASAIEEALLLFVALSVLISGHALMRSRAKRLLAEDGARRLTREAELRDQVGDCEQRRKSLSEFAQLASHVAHEVRNPLNAIMLNSELLEDEVRRCECEGSGEAAALIASIQKEAARLQHLTDEYLAFARPPTPSRGHHSLNAVVDDVAHLIREEARRQSVTIETRMSQNCPCALLDPDQLKQATLNLVRNALQAMPGGGRLTIGTDVLAGGAVTLSVADTGPGVPAELRCRVFEPFFTSKADGTGLGLPLAVHIARDHGGDLTLEGDGGTGARFVITLPPPDARTGPCSCAADQRDGAGAEGNAS